MKTVQEWVQEWSTALLEACPGARLLPPLPMEKGQTPNTFPCQIAIESRRVNFIVSIGRGGLAAELTAERTDKPSRKLWQSEGPIEFSKLLVIVRTMYERQDVVPFAAEAAVRETAVRGITLVDELIDAAYLYGQDRSANEDVMAVKEQLLAAVVPLLWQNGNPATVKCSKCGIEAYVAALSMTRGRGPRGELLALYVDDWLPPSKWSKITIQEISPVIVTVTLGRIYACQNCTVEVK